MAAPRGSNNSPVDPNKIVRIDLAGGIEENPITVDNNYPLNPSLREGKLLYNVFTETTKGDEIKENKERIIMRSPINNYYINSSSPGAPRGIYYWEATNSTYYSYDNNVSYYNAATGVNTSLVTLANSTGIVGFTEYYKSDTAQRFLIISDGVQLYVVTTGNSVTTMTSGANNIPNPHIPHPVVLDGYIFLVKEGTKDIYTSVLNLPTSSWITAAFISAEQYPDVLVGLARHRGSIIAFGSSSIEFFYNAAIPSPNSPLARNEAYTKRIGLFNAGSITELEDNLFFIGTTKNGDIGVYAVDDSRVVKISSPYIDRWIRRYFDYPNTYGQCKMFSWKTRGHSFICVQLFYNTSMANVYGTRTTFSVTLAYDIHEKKWCMFGARNPENTPVKTFNLGESGTTYYSLPVPIFETTLVKGQSAPGVSAYRTVGLSITNKALYDMSDESFTGDDYGSVGIDFCIRTGILDYNSSLNKTIYKVFLYGTKINYSQYSALENLNLFTFTNNSKDYNSVYPVARSYDPREITFTTNFGQFRQIQFEIQGSGTSLAHLEGLETHLQFGNT